MLFSSTHVPHVGITGNVSKFVFLSLIPQENHQNIFAQMRNSCSSTSVIEKHSCLTPGVWSKGHFIAWIEAKYEQSTDHHLISRFISDNKITSSIILVRITQEKNNNPDWKQSWDEINERKLPGFYLFFALWSLIKCIKAHIHGRLSAGCVLVRL